jgi:hypothetical protein
LPARQAQGEGQTKDFSDLPHVGAGTHHRFLLLSKPHGEGGHEGEGAASAVLGGGSSRQPRVRIGRPEYSTATAATEPGGKIKDTATISGGDHPTGTITFKVFSTASCATEVG